MKKNIVIIALFIIILFSGCSASNLDFTVDTAPRYKADQSYPIVLKAIENGESISGLQLVATLEMARMDHGIIEVVFTDVGNGLYEGEVALPMGGEWIANIVAVKNGKEVEEIVTFQVNED